MKSVAVYVGLLAVLVVCVNSKPLGALGGLVGNLGKSLGKVLKHSGR